MKAAYLILVLLSATACGQSTGNSHTTIPSTGTVAPLLNFDPQLLPLTLADEIYSKFKAESVVECQPSISGDRNCRLASESKVIILESNPNAENRTYRIEYENSCKRQNAAPKAKFASGIIVKAQPESDGDVHGEIYLNMSEILTIRGNGDLRLEEINREMLSQTLEKGCFLIVHYSLASPN